jgi:hypothetical protein
MGDKVKKKYKKDYGAMRRVFMRLEPFTAEEITALELPVMLAYAKLKVGACSEQGFFDLYTALIAGAVRARDIHKDVVAAMEEATAHLREARKRAERHGKYLLTGVAFEPVGVAVDLHNQMIRNSTPMQMKEALQLAIIEEKERDAKRTCEPSDVASVTAVCSNA